MSEVAWSVCLSYGEEFDALAARRRGRRGFGGRARSAALGGSSGGSLGRRAIMEVLEVTAGGMAL
jgi:hypothetical protein